MSKESSKQTTEGVLNEFPNQLSKEILIELLKIFPKKLSQKFTKKFPMEFSKNIKEFKEFPPTRGIFKGIGPCYFRRNFSERIPKTIFNEFAKGIFIRIIEEVCRGFA